MALFGARKQADQLAAQLAQSRANEQYLASELANSGALTKVEIEAQINAARQELSAIRSLLANEKAAATQAINAELATLNQLRNTVINVRDAGVVQDVGLYDFEHPAESSVALMAELSNVRQQIKDKIKNNTAWSATQNFTFNNSEAKGRKFVNDLAKLSLAAYNAEVENAIKTVKGGNLDTAIKRLRSIADRIARYGSMINLHITPTYAHLRELELTLASKHMRALELEKEAERERKAELREQARAEAELKRERQRLDEQLKKEREHYQNVIAALRAKGDEAAANAAQAEMEAKIADVNKAIADVDYRVANQKAGYVYVISNLGAFGERMVKIGMTRRLEPMDRIKELGDASVPFGYDVHALFFSDDAPGTEAMLHREFSDRRVNKINQRREFFYCTPQDVLNVLKEKDVTVLEYTLEPAAEEFRMSGGFPNMEMQEQTLA